MPQRSHEACSRNARGDGHDRRRGPRGAARSSELERELQRELHRMPPPALLPTPETLACYERLGQDLAFRAAADPVRAGAMRDRSIWCGSTA